MNQFADIEFIELLASKIWQIDIEAYQTTDDGISHIKLIFAEHDVKIAYYLMLYIAYRLKSIEMSLTIKIVKEASVELRFKLPDKSTMTFKGGIYDRERLNTAFDKVLYDTKVFIAAYTIKQWEPKPVWVAEDFMGKDPIAGFSASLYSIEP